MAGAFSGLYISSQSLRNFQRALETSGHNIANVDTPGYSRQRVGLAAMDPIAYYDRGWQTRGQGAFVANVTRARDLFLEAASQRQTANLGRFQTTVKGLVGIDQIYGEPTDRGITAALDQFFNAWSAMGSNPTDPGMRTQVREAGQTLADRVRGSWHEFERQRLEVTSQVGSTIRQINDLASQIDSYNKAIRAAVVTQGSPNDVLDKRDAAIRELSQLVDVATFPQQDGTLTVVAGGFSLVDAAGTRPFPTTFDAAAGTVTDGLATYQVRGGQLLGQFATLVNLEGQQSRLDTLANNLRTEVNSIHLTGTAVSGLTNLRFFNDVTTPPQTGATDFDLDQVIKDDLENIVIGVSGERGDSGLAQALSDLRDTSVPGLGNATFGRYHAGTVDSIASSLKYFRAAMETEEAVLRQTENRIQAVSGVSIDEEMADMLRFQRSYQAAARALTIFDETTAEIIGMLRR
jgi:flagellar hook-associated protein 1 FlgK